MSNFPIETGFLNLNIYNNENVIIHIIIEQRYTTISLYLNNKYGNNYMYRVPRVLTVKV